MPFIGTQPDVGGYSVLDNLTASATANYTLQKDSANFVPSSANQLLVSLNGVIQKPGTSFSVSGSTLTFSSALTSGDSIDFIISMGEPLLVGVPSDATITGSKLASNIGISTTGNIATTGSGTLSVAGTSTLTGNTTVAGTLTNTGLITASAGVAIGGTGAANTIDDYEEGTWTPQIIGYSQSTSNLTQTYAQQHGQYTKIGRHVFANFNVRLSAKGNITGNYTLIQGLPFPLLTGTGVMPGTGHIHYIWSLGTARDNLAFEGGGGTATSFWLTYMDGTTTTYVNTSDVGNSTGFMGTLIYMTT